MPVSHPPAPTIRRGSNTSAVLEAVLKDDEEEKGTFTRFHKVLKDEEEEKDTFTRFQKPWQLHNQRQVATFAHQGRERKPGAGPRRRRTPSQGSRNLGSCTPRG